MKITMNVCNDDGGGGEAVAVVGKDGIEVDVSKPPEQA